MFAHSHPLGLADFQFSLWDSKERVRFVEAAEKDFQFSLWDSLVLAARYPVTPYSFNSLCEIPAPPPHALHITSRRF